MQRVHTIGHDFLFTIRLIWILGKKVDFLCPVLFWQWCPVGGYLHQLLLDLQLPSGAIRDHVQVRFSHSVQVRSDCWFGGYTIAGLVLHYG